MPIDNVESSIGASSLLITYLKNKKVLATDAKDSAVAQGAALQTINTQKPAMQNITKKASLPHGNIVQSQTLHNTLQNAPAIKNSAMHPAMPQTDTLVKSKDENTKNPSIISKAKDFFKKPKTKKVLIKALKAAVILAFITAITIISARKKPTSDTPFELDESVEDLTLTLYEILSE